MRKKEEKEEEEKDGKNVEQTKNKRKISKYRVKIEKPKWMNGREIENRKPDG